MKTIRTKFYKWLVNFCLIILVLANFGLIQLWSFYGDCRLQIVFLDIGQGDGYLIRTPDKFTMLVDAGKDDAVLKPLGRNVKQWETIDVVMLSHPDADHVGNLEMIVNKYSVKNIIYNPVVHDLGAYNNFQNLVSKKNKVRFSPIAEDVFQLGCCVALKIFWPGVGYSADSKHPVSDSEVDTNDTSVSFLLTYGKFKMFSGGDLSTKFEDQIAEKYRNEFSGTDVLKISHHGSKNSTSLDFLKVLHPYISIIQVGKDNSYGHPNEEVIQNLNEINSRVYRNDQNGQITYLTDGYSYEIKTESNK